MGKEHISFLRKNREHVTWHVIYCVDKQTLKLYWLKK